MTTIKRFTYDEDKITAVAVDQINNFCWVAYAQDLDGNCVIKKLFGFDPDQVFFDIDKAVTNINAMALDSSNLYVAYEDGTLLGEILLQTNPLTVTTEITIPVGIVEAPVDVAVNGTDLFFLIPGVASGTNAKILKYNTSGVFQETIDLVKTGIEVTNASTMDIADTGDIWVGTNTDPSTVVRVFITSGGAFDFTVNEVI